jgi:hypothetical protein
VEALIQIPTGVPGFTGILKPGMGNAVGTVFDVTENAEAVPARIQPLANETVGVVAGGTSTPPGLYHTSAVMVPVLKVFEIPVIKIELEELTWAVTAVEPLLAVKGGEEVMVICPTADHHANKPMPRESSSFFMIGC